MLFLFFFYLYGAHRDLHSFPTRRSSDLQLRLFPEIPADWRDEALAGKWAGIRRLRRVVTGALEVERREKRIGSSLQAHPTVYAPAELIAAFDGVDAAEIAITSGLTFAPEAPPADAFTLEDVDGVGVVAAPAEGGKCARCWRVLAEVGDDAAHPELCGRCVEAIAEIPIAEAG